MGKKIKVTPEELEKAGNKLCALSEEYQALYEQLYQQVDTLDQDWDGMDNDTFTQQIREFEDDFGNMYKELQEAGQTLKEMGKKYRETQEEIKMAAAKLPKDY